MHGDRPGLLIVGVGNPMYGDDALGYCIARAIETCLEPEENIRVIPKPTLTIADAALLEGQEKIVIVDSAEGLEKDYALYEVTGSEEDLEAYSRPMDSHSVSPINIVAVARTAGVRIGRVYLLLVKPERIGFGEGLTREAMERALQATRFLCSRVTEPPCSPDPECVRSRMEECVGNPLIDL